MTPVLLITFGLAGLALVFILAFAVRDRRRTVPAQSAREPETRPPSVPAPTEAHDRAAETVVLPLVHTGADEEWSPLAALAEAGSSPDLATEVEQIAEYHAAFDAMMADFRHDLDHILDGVCRRLDPLWARVDTDTSEWPVLTDEGLHAWMAGQPETAEVVR